MNSDALMIFDGSFPSLTPSSEENDLRNATADLFSDNREQQSTFQVLIQDLEETIGTFARNDCLMENTNKIESYGYNNHCNIQQIQGPYINSVYYEDNQPHNKIVHKMTNSNSLGAQLEPLSLPQSAKTRKVRRAVYSPMQRQELEEAFSKNQFVSKVTRKELSTKLNLTEIQIKTWFQNKRMKEKKISKGCANFSTNLSLTLADSCSSNYSMSPSPPQAASSSLIEHQGHPENNGNYFLQPNYVYEQCKMNLSLYSQNQWNCYANQYASETMPFSYWQTPVNRVFQYNGIPYLQQSWNSQFYNNFQYPGSHVIKIEPVEDSSQQYFEQQCLDNLGYEHNQILSPYMQNNFRQLGNCSVDSTSGFYN